LAFFHLAAFGKKHPPRIFHRFSAPMLGLKIGTDIFAEGAEIT
jgi:hypothetical protein